LTQSGHWLGANTDLTMHSGHITATYGVEIFGRAKACSYCSARPPDASSTRCTLGGSQVPLRIEGSFSLGQYMRNINWNFPVGAGSQFASLSAPGDLFWM